MIWVNVDHEKNLLPTMVLKAVIFLSECVLFSVNINFIFKLFCFDVSHREVVEFLATGYPFSFIFFTLLLELA